jgi:hypothetical protein
MAKRLAVLSLVLLAVLSAISALVPGAWADYPVPLVMTGIIMVYTITFSFLFWEMTHDTPVAVGFSQGAVHLRFKPGKKRPDQYLSIPWNEVERYTSNPERKMAHVKFYTEKRIEYVIIPKGLVKSLDESFKKARTTG